MLLNFASLGVVFARRRLLIENPRVALLSVGEEAAKGNRQVQESYSSVLGTVILTSLATWKEWTSSPTKPT